MTEIWKDIPGYEGLYQVSNMGRVKRLEGYDAGGRYREEHCLKPQVDGSNYLQVYLFKNGEGTLTLVHRLVAKAFIPNPDGKPTVNHLDENKHNNAAWNLEWATRKEQMNYGSAMESHKKPVVQCDLQGRRLKLWESAAAVEKNIGIHHTSVAKCCLGKLKTCHGYVWRYAS